MSHLIRKIVALIILGALLASQVIAAPRIMSHSECSMMNSTVQSFAERLTPAASVSYIMPVVQIADQSVTMSDHCNEQHQDRCSADHCVSASAGLIKQHDFSIPLASQPVADAPYQLVPAPLSSPYHPPIFL